VYNALPHLRHKVVTNNHDAASVLKWAVSEMDRRYKLLHANNARNLADFNRKAEEGKPLRMPERPKLTLSVLDDEGYFGTAFPEGVDELKFHTIGVIKDLVILHQLFELFATTLNRLCHIGSAYEDDPKIRL